MKSLRTLSLLLVVVLMLIVSTQTSALTPRQPASAELAATDTPTPTPSTPQSPAPGLDIVGGQEAQPGAWPWMTALVLADQSNAFDGQFCGGALIDPEWVLTAAHCTEESSAADIDVVVGRHRLSDNDGERISVAEIIQHPAYNPRTVDSDIALLRLSSASSQPTVSVVGSSDDNLFAPGVLATVIGWGLTDPDDDASFVDTLRQVSVPIVSNATCNAPDAYAGDVTANMLCAGYAEGGKDSCSGDSGGPLVVPDAGGNGWLQAGIVSWGDGCAAPNSYGVYTRIANFKSWIGSHLGDAATSTPTATGVPPTATATATATHPPATATPTPTDAPPTVTPTPSPSSGGGTPSQLLQDPGFEAGFFSSPWVARGDAYTDFESDDFFPAHSGTQYASLLGIPNARGTLYQAVDIPADIKAATLHFWWRTSGGSSLSSESFATMYVQVRAVTGTLLETLAEYDEHGPTDWQQSEALSLTEYAGRRVRITFHGRSNAQSDYDYFDLDDVTLQVQAPSCCDLNNDGVVDLDDAQRVALEWGQTDSPYDFNNSGKVDVADVLFVVSQITGN